MTDIREQVAFVGSNHLPLVGQWTVRDCTDTIHADYEVFDATGRLVAMLPGYHDRPVLEMAIEVAAALSCSFGEGAK